MLEALVAAIGFLRSMIETGLDLIKVKRSLLVDCYIRLNEHNCATWTCVCSPHYRSGPNLTKRTWLPIRSGVVAGQEGTIVERDVTIDICSVHRGHFHFGGFGEFDGLGGSHIRCFCEKIALLYRFRCL